MHTHMDLSTHVVHQTYQKSFVHPFSSFRCQNENWKTEHPCPISKCPLLLLAPAQSAPPLSLSGHGKNAVVRRGKALCL